MKSKTPKITFLHFQAMAKPKCSLFYSPVYHSTDGYAITGKTAKECLTRAEPHLREYLKTWTGRPCLKARSDWQITAAHVSVEGDDHGPIRGKA